jgi:hypothetical protein
MAGKMPVILMILVISCSSDQRAFSLIDMELEESITEIDDEIMSRIRCYRQVLVDVDTAKTVEGIHTFYQEFSQIIVTKDSIIQIAESLNTSEWLVILTSFKNRLQKLKGIQRCHGHSQDR